MKPSWIVIGITGATCSGKTTLAKNLVATLSPGRIHMISQDDYFLDVDDARHIWLPQLNHIHFDIITSLDMDRMSTDIRNLLNSDISSNLFQNNAMKPAETYCNFSSDMRGKLATLRHFLSEGNVHVLIIEGFSIFDQTLPQIFDLCQLRYFFTLNYDECKLRRSQRTYEPPDCDGYFDICVWPEYQKYFQFVQAKYEQHVHYFESNAKSIEISLLRVINDLIDIIN